MASLRILSPFVTTLMSIVSIVTLARDGTGARELLPRRAAESSSLGVDAWLSFRIARAFVWCIEINHFSVNLPFDVSNMFEGWMDDQIEGQGLTLPSWALSGLVSQS